MEKAQKLNATNFTTHTPEPFRSGSYQSVCSINGYDKDSNLLGHNAMQIGNQFLIL
jgi:hypothetical protein